MGRRALIATILVSAAVSSVAPAPAARIATRERIGRSVEGTRLKAVNIGARSSRTKILVVGCMHGNECAGKAILSKLRDMRSPKGFELWMIWSLNPDGEARGSRQNAHGVDLNRNFRTGWKPNGEPGDTYYSGPEPNSEPETRAAVRFIKEHRPDITIWYHQAMALVTKRKRHNRIPRLYAREVGLPLRHLDPLPGTASRWQNKRWPGHTSFVVELRGGAMSDKAARRHARAVKTVARAW